MNVRRILPVLVASALAALAVSPAVASAPSDQYLTFNVQNQTIYDDYTKLTWQRRVDTSKLLNVQGAEAYCATFNGAGGGPWRLPTYKELLTLVDENPHYEYDPKNGEALHYIDPNAFVGTPPAAFASVSYDAKNPTSVFVVDFGTGQATTGGSSGSYYVRCVR